MPACCCFRTTITLPPAADPLYAGATPAAAGAVLAALARVPPEMASAVVSANANEEPSNLRRDDQPDSTCGLTIGILPPVTVRRPPYLVVLRKHKLIARFCPDRSQRGDYGAPRRQAAAERRATGAEPAVTGGGGGGAAYATCRSERPDGDLRRGGQQTGDLVIKAAERDRRARHVQRRAVLADVVAPDVNPALAELLMRIAVQQVQLTDRRAAQPVDHERDVVALAERQVSDDCLQELVHDVVGAGQLLPPAARLAVDPDTHLHLVLAELEQRRALGGRRAGRQRHTHGPGHRVHLVADPQQLIQVSPLLGRGPHRFDHEEIPGHAAAAHGIGRVLHRHVVVHEQGADRDAVGFGHLLTHLEGHAVAGG